ncbi:unnamed protein product [Gongylonema pulchrum]|uniref:Uncharacterized protein n=1 Tax=Gongylonema pulchrum TaxID=637853 RepID=A0A183DQN7_9BILA|nr:unnamed protein product [Gongylonema pulchrum]
MFEKNFSALSLTIVSNGKDSENRCIQAVNFFTLFIAWNKIFFVFRQCSNSKILIFQFDGSTSPICLPNGNFSLMAAYNLYDFGFGENELGEKMSRLNYGSAMITAVSQYHDFIRAGPIFSSSSKNRSRHGICNVTAFARRLNSQNLKTRRLNSQN